MSTLKKSTLLVLFILSLLGMGLTLINPFEVVQASIDSQAPLILAEGNGTVGGG